MNAAPDDASPPPSEPGHDNGTVGSLAELYLGNILYALELAALSLERDGKAEAAAFYRGIGKKLAEARGRAAK